MSPLSSSSAPRPPSERVSARELVFGTGLPVCTIELHGSGSQYRRAGVENIETLPEAVERCQQLLGNTPANPVVLVVEHDPLNDSSDLAPLLSSLLTAGRSLGVCLVIVGDEGTIGHLARLQAGRVVDERPQKAA
ncbi:hypothetical protein [Luteococcus sp. OSA5]|uniref:hypothetical protein n=1 Tax=Luteococcus sp. OSA5 TaxID=3401630 RepID=UPI003B438488